MLYNYLNTVLCNCVCPRKYNNKEIPFYIHIHKIVQSGNLFMKFKKISISRESSRQKHLLSELAFLNK